MPVSGSFIQTVIIEQELRHYHKVDLKGNNIVYNISSHIVLVCKKDDPLPQII